MHEERNPIIAVGEQEFRSPGVQVHSWHEQTHARSEEYVGHCECGTTASFSAEGAIGRKTEAQDTRLFPASILLGDLGEVMPLCVSVSSGVK